MDRRGFLQRLSALAAVPVVGPLVVDRPVLVNQQELGLALPEQQQLVIAKEMPRRAAGLEGFVSSLDISNNLMDATLPGDTYRHFMPARAPHFRFVFEGDVLDHNLAEMDRLVGAIGSGKVRLYVEVA